MQAQGAWAQTENVYWNGTGTDADPYLIENSNDWAQLEWRLREGDNYSSKVFRLTRDIETGLMIGTESRPFNGILDGDSHTLTFNAGTKDAPVTTPCAPLYCVSGATIRHLNTEGTIYTNAKFAGGIVSRISGSTSTTIADCHSAITISSGINGDGTHGGLVAVVSENTAELLIENCSFTGSLMNTGKNVTTDCGGFVGWSYVPVTVNNGIFAPANSGIYGFFDRINSGANFVRMSNNNMGAGKVRLTDCYATVYMSLNSDWGYFYTKDGDLVNFDGIDRMNQGSNFSYTVTPDGFITPDNYIEKAPKVESMRYMDGKIYAKVNGMQIVFTRPTEELNARLEEFWLMLVEAGMIGYDDDGYQIHTDIKGDNAEEPARCRQIAGPAVLLSR